jgi:glycine dehydrogenase
MKLNATSEMLPVTWPEFSRLHPFAPIEQTKGYQELFHQLESWLAEITGLSAVSLQPNAGSQGEYTGLMVIRAYHRSRVKSSGMLLTIPLSARHESSQCGYGGYDGCDGACDRQGNVDLTDL